MIKPSLSPKFKVDNAPVVWDVASNLRILNISKQDTSVMGYIHLYTVGGLSSTKF